jgi:hypothetical protein
MSFDYSSALAKAISEFVTCEFGVERRAPSNLNAGAAMAGGRLAWRLQSVD